MAKQKISFSAQVDFNLNVENAKKDLKTFEQSLQNVANMPEVGKKTKSDALDLAQRINNAASIDTSNMGTEKLKQHQQDLNKLKQEYFKIMNAVSNATVAEIEGQEELKNKLELQNSKYKKIAGSIGQYLNSLEKIRAKTAAITSEAEKGKQLMGDIGVDFTSPSSIKSKMDAMPRTAKGEIKGAENKILYKQLEDHLAKINELTNDGKDSVESLEEEYARVTLQLNKQMEAAAQTRENKAKLVEEIVKQAVEEGKLTQEQGEQVIAQQKKLDLEEQETEELQKQKALDSGEDIEKNINQGKKLAESNEKVKKSFLAKITAATLYLAALRALRKTMTSVMKTVTELDKSVSEVAMVTNMTREQSWKLVGTYQDLAREVGMTTSEVARLSVFFFRQGRAAKDALELTKVAAIASRVASIDATESANYLTSAINGFGLAASQSMAVSDKFAALGASSASSYEEMAIALSKVAPVAKLSGVSIDFMMGVIAKGIETTREAPENIGTAFKTIFARMTQIRDFGATLDDSVGVNTVEEALKQADVALRDSTGNFRDMDDVLTELGHKFDTLTRNQQTYIATALAGTRQQSRLLAVMQNFNRTVDLVNISMNSTGATLAQQAVFSGGLEAALARLSNAFQKLVLSISNSEMIIDFVNFFGNAINAVAEEFERNGERIAIAAGLLGIVFVGALIKVKIAAYQVAGALTAQATALAFTTGGLSLIIPTLIAVAGALGLYFGFLRKAETEEQKFEKASRKLNESIKENQVALFNFTKQANDVNKLKTRYTELNKKIIKTTEEMEELDSLGAQIKKLAQEDYGIMLEVDASVTDTAQLVIDQLMESRKKELGESVDLGQTRIDQAVKFGGLDEIDQFDPVTEMSSVTMAVASQLFGVDNFINASAEQQERMLEIARNNVNLYITDLIKLKKEQQSLFNVRSAEIEIGNLERLILFAEGPYRKEFIASYKEDIAELRRRIDEFNASPPITPTLDMPSGETILNFVDSFQNMLDNKLSQSEVDKLFQDFLGLNEIARQSILNNIEELKELSQLSLTSIRDILTNQITDVSGRKLMAGELIDIAGILSDNGLNQQEIENFFSSLESFTVAGIDSFLDTIDDQVQKSALEEDFFNYITKNASPQEFMNNIEKSKNSVRTLLDLQQKYIDEGLGAEEFATVTEALGSGPLLEDFFAGTLTGQAIAGTQVNKFKDDIAQAIAFTNERIENVGEDGSPGLLMGLKNELLMYERILADIDFLVFDAGMEEFYETQKQQIEEINVRLQEQLELEQKKLDMNRSMLSLNRQIAALERDTSFGAQARLEDLRLTRSQEAAQREAFILETMANQQLEGLPDEVQSEIKTNTARTANGIAELVRLMGGKSSDFKVIETSTGNSVGGGGGSGGGSLITLASN